VAGASTVSGAAPSVPALAGAAAVLLAVLALPDRPQALLAGLASPPLELPLILLALVLVPQGRIALALRGVLTGWLAVVLLLKIGDFGMQAAFSRPINPVLDLPLLRSGFDLASGAVGRLGAVLVVAGLAGLFALVVAALWWATGQWARLRPAPPARRLAALGAVLAGGLVLAEAGHAGRTLGLPGDLPGRAAAARLIPERVALLRRTFADLSAFRAAAETDRFAGVTGLLDRLQGRETAIVFVESYGRTSFDTPLYSATHIASLRAAEPALRQAGFALRSGWLTSPIVGGQSWLAHGTLASGLRLDSQTRYGAMLASPHRTLYDIAAGEGFRTLAVMPAITLAWPEGGMLGFTEIFGAADLGYRGRPYNWVTMPDQYTLTVFDRIRAAGQGDTLLAQVVLISSHAPWVPVPELVAWDAVGDGTILNRWAEAGDPPEVVWRDPDRVREQYRQSIDYSLRTVMAHAARQTGRLPLIVVLGDHQPAPFVAQDDSRDVPVHVIGPPDLVALTDSWGWTDGLVPDAALPAWPMEAFRDRFLEAFSSTVPPA
jgi:hypothetical protein